MESHPFSSLFPLLDNDALKSLAEDIRANGFRANMAGAIKASC